MAKQMLIDATRGQQTEMPPWLPYAGVHCAALIDQPADTFLKDAGLLAQGVVKAAELYHADGIPLLFDLSVEAESMGCEATYWEDNVPSIMTHPCVEMTPEQAGLKIPSAADGRWPVIFEAAKLAKLRLETLDCAMLGLLCGPLTLASHLAGPQTFAEFVTPNCQPAIDVIHEAGLTSTFFICGNCNKVLEEVCKVPTHGFAIDEQMNLSYVRDMAYKYGKGFGGNLKLTTSLMLGMISPREDALISLAAGGTQGYTFAPG